MHDLETLRILRLMDRMRGLFADTMPICDDEPVWKVVSHLVRLEIYGRAVTLTALCDVTGLPYATARRLINRLIADGLIQQRTRSATGKTHTLHPSKELLDRFNSYAAQIKGLLAQTIGGSLIDEDEGNYYFGGQQPERSDGGKPSATLEPDIKFLFNADNFARAIRNKWCDFRTRLGSAKNFHILPCPQLHAELLANSSRETSQYDVVAVKFPWIGEMTEAGVLRPLDSLLGDETKRPVVPRRSEFGYWKGRFYGLPLYATMNLLAIRKDLFADAGLNPPKTLDDLLLAARSLSTPERAAIVWDAARGMPVAHSFMFFIGAFGTPVVNVVGGRIAGRIEEANLEELIPMVASDAGRAALDFMHRLRELSPPGILDLAWDQSLEIFLTGGAAMSICWSNRAARFEYDPRSVVGQRVMHMPLPTRYGSAPSVPLGGFLLSIPANLPESRVQQAAEAIQLVTSVDEISRGELPIVPNFGLSADPEMRVAMGIAHSARKWGAGGLLHSWQRPAIPQYYVIETILGEEIYAALAGEKSDRDALRDASDRMEQALAETAGSRAFLLDAAQ